MHSNDAALTRNNSHFGQYEQFYADWDVNQIKADLELEAELAYQESLEGPLYDQMSKGLSFSTKNKQTEELDGLGSDIQYQTYKRVFHH